jgi:hypothetical protein
VQRVIEIIVLNVAEVVTAADGKIVRTFADQMALQASGVRVE